MGHDRINQGGLSGTVGAHNDVHFPLLIFRFYVFENIFIFDAATDELRISNKFDILTSCGFAYQLNCLSPKNLLFSTTM